MRGKRLFSSAFDRRLPKAFICVIWWWCLLCTASCILHPALLPVCVLVWVCAQCALFVAVPVGGAHKICTILHFDICMRRHVVAFIYPSIWGQLCPPISSPLSLSLFHSLLLPLGNPATLHQHRQQLTSAKNCIFSIWCRVNNSYIALSPADTHPFPLAK